jgi:hypothetical protein
MRQRPFHIGDPAMRGDLPLQFLAGSRRCLGWIERSDSGHCFFLDRAGRHGEL